MPMSRMDISVGLLGGVVGSDDLNEDFLKFVLGVLVTKLCGSAFDKQLAGLDDADGATDLFDFGHDVGGKNDGLAVLAPFADERSDGASCQEFVAIRGFVVNHNSADVT